MTTSTLTREAHPRLHFATRDEDSAAIFEFAEIYYNRERLYSPLNREAPDT